MPTRRARLFWKAKVRLAAYQATVVVTVSEYSARQLGQVMGIARERIRVVGEAPAPAYRPSAPDDVDAAAAKAGVPAGAPWFTYVGGFNPHKRVDTIVRAHAEAVRRTAGAPPHLLLVGTLSDDVFHGNVEEIRAAIERAGTAHLVHWTGFVPDEELRHLHSGATALILVSEMEGYGLPAVEAAACGAPVIATVESPLPELLEGGGVFVKAGDADALAAAMVRLLGDPALQRRMGARALARASALSWSDGARVALEALGEAAAVRRELTPWEVMA
jgi:glycosyltransferase involved in cell wall biosynthesis